MDDNFEMFLEEMGQQAIDRRNVPQATLDKYRGKLPDRLLGYWQEFGWAGYGDGLFWSVDPEEYEPVLEAWIGETRYMEIDAFHLVARTAFGKLYFFGEKTGQSLTISAPFSMSFPNDPFETETEKGLHISAGILFSGTDKKRCDCEDINEKPLFNRAVKKFGRLNHDEMYGFVPALALGGKADIANLQKVKAVEHLILLAQFAPLEEVTLASFGVAE
jgi:hypothetical protein